MEIEVDTFSPRLKTSTNKDKCCVYACNSTTNADLTLKFHSFPKPNESRVDILNSSGQVENVDKLEAWKGVLNIENVAKRMKVCSSHFRKSDYFLPDHSKIKQLKQNAIPSCNLQKGCELQVEEVDETELQSVQQQNCNQTSIIKEEIKLEDDNLYESYYQEDANNSIYEIHMNQKPSENLVSEETVISNCKKDEACSVSPKVQDVMVQVNLNVEEPVLFLKLLKDDKDLYAVAGIKSFKILNNIVKRIKEIDGDDFEKDYAFLKPKAKIVMTFTKLKQDLSYDFLAALFDCHSEKVCQQIFDKTIITLNKCLDPINGTLKGETLKLYRQISKAFTALQAKRTDDIS